MPIDAQDEKEKKRGDKLCHQISLWLMSFLFFLLNCTVAVVLSCFNCRSGKQIKPTSFYHCTSAAQQVNLQVVLFTSLFIEHSGIVASRFFVFFFTQCTHFKRSLLVLLLLATKANLALAVRVFHCFATELCHC